MKTKLIFSLSISEINTAMSIMPVWFGALAQERRRGIRCLSGGGAIALILDIFLPSGTGTVRQRRCFSRGLFKAIRKRAAAAADELDSRSCEE
ncbi:MAG: hypothetical protein F4X77_07285 [Acidobacteriia bacterium]|nr:hypothetical protein [Terriglobia bacterium]MYC67428.1 hypothetical protein [Terriglobia bacterium]